MNVTDNEAPNGLSNEATKGLKKGGKVAEVVDIENKGEIRDIATLKGLVYNKVVEKTL